MIGKVEQFRALQEAMQFASQNHRVSSQNLANINTPGYQTREVDFDQLLDRLDGKARKLTSTDYEVSQVDGLAERRDGNNVDLDRELAALKKNTLAYQTLTQLLGSKMGILKQAING
ncbi:MAG: flagellar basal body rod protein FlgB [Mariniblastus sp.]|nr:flagellar basal body rod protein FlgB [Mariniblastus sp.]